MIIPLSWTGLAGPGAGREKAVWNHILIWQIPPLAGPPPTERRFTLADWLARRIGKRAGPHLGRKPESS